MSTQTLTRSSSAASHQAVVLPSERPRVAMRLPITSFRVNPASGALAFTGRYEPVGSPAMMLALNSR